MRRRIAASVGFLGLIGATWLGVREHVIGSEPPTAPLAVPTTVPTAAPIAEPFFERIDAKSAKRSKRPTVVPTAESSFEQLSQRLQPVLKKRFPKCDIEIVCERNRIVIKGSATTAQEAAAIVVAVQTAVDLHSPVEHPQSGQVVNLLEIPGDAQVLLRVKIIEANRNVMNAAFQRLSKSDQPSSKLEPRTHTETANGATQSGVFAKSAVEQITAKLAKDPSSTLVAEPSMTVLSGHVTSFISGGNFKVPIIVGVGGAQGTMTTFRSIGTDLVVRPTVIDNEQLRLELTCESNQIDEANLVAGIPGITSRRINIKVSLKPDQTAVMLVPTQPAHTANGEAQDAAQKKNEPANSERCLFVAVTPEVLKPLETNEVLPQPIVARAGGPSMSHYTPMPSFWSPGTYPEPLATLRTEPVPALRDLLLRTPLPATEWSQPMSPPLPPPFSSFGGPIQQLGGWQPMPPVSTPWPSAGPSPSHLVSKPSRLEHLQIAAQNLEAAGLTDQVAEIQKEITLERTSEVRRELRRRERELETLQRQIEELRRSLAPEEVPQPE